MKGKTMSEKNNGWEKPEEKFPETEFEDSFAGFFSKEEEMSKKFLLILEKNIAELLK